MADFMRDLRNDFDHNQGEFPTWDIDGLTKINNKASFLLDFPNIRGSVGILIVDLDEFKQLNDKYGHSKGDIVLRSVASDLAQSLRENDNGGREIDTIYRYGGDEFIIVLYNIKSSKDLKKVAQRFHNLIVTKTIEGIDANVDYKQKLTIGGAVADFDGTNNQKNFDKADKMLYKAKKGGRNQVQVA